MTGVSVRIRPSPRQGSRQRPRSQRRGGLRLCGALSLALAGWLLCAAAGHAKGWEYEQYVGAYDTPYDWEWDWYYDSYYEDGRYGLQGLRHQSDWDLRDKIKGELTQNPLIEEEDILVLVEDGIVTLKGIVEDDEAIHQAIEEAHAAGATDVINNLRTEQ